MLKSFSLLFVLVMSLSNTAIYAGPSKSDQDQKCIKMMKIPPLFNSMVKVGRCQKASYYRKFLKGSNLTGQIKGNANKYRTRKRLCTDRFKGIYARAVCMRSKSKSGQYEAEAEEVAKREFSDLDKKWKYKTIDQICGEFGLKKRHWDTCHNMSDSVEDKVKFYMTRRDQSKKADLANSIKNATISYAKLDKAQRNKRLMKKTNLTFLKGTLKSWKSSKEVCNKVGLNLPNSKDFTSNKGEVIGYARATLNKKNKIYLVANVSDELNAQMYFNSKGEADVNNGNRFGGNIAYIVCKKLSSKEKKKLAKKEEAEKKLIKKFTASSPLDFLQKVVTLSSSEELMYLTKYSGRKIDLSLGDSWAQFTKVNDQTWVHTTSTILYNKKNRPKSSNIFKWQFKPNASQRSYYQKQLSGQVTSSTVGITKQGFEKFVTNLKKQPLFNALSNRNVTTDKYSITFHGSFKDSKGQSHTVNIQTRATNFRIWIN